MRSFWLSVGLAIPLLFVLFDHAATPRAARAVEDGARVVRGEPLLEDARAAAPSASAPAGEAAAVPVAVDGAWWSSLWPSGDGEPDDAVLVVLVPGAGAVRTARGGIRSERLLVDQAEGFVLREDRVVAAGRGAASRLLIEAGWAERPLVIRGHAPHDAHHRRGGR